MITVEQVEDAIKVWVEEVCIPECKKNNEEYNARVDDPNYKYATKKRGFNPDHYRGVAGRRTFFDWMSNGSDQELNIGTAEYVNSYREDAYFVCIFKIGDEHFMAMTDYDSWSDWDWDYASLQKVEPVKVEVTQWKVVG